MNSWEVIHHPRGKAAREWDTWRASAQQTIPPGSLTIPPTPHLVWAGWPPPLIRPSGALPEHWSLPMHRLLSCGSLSPVSREPSARWQLARLLGQASLGGRSRQQHPLAPLTMDAPSCSFLHNAPPGVSPSLHPKAEAEPLPPPPKGGRWPESRCRAHKRRIQWGGQVGQLTSTSLCSPTPFWS